MTGYKVPGFWCRDNALGDLQGDSERICDMWGSHIDDGASPDPSGVVNTAIPGRTSRLRDLNGDGGADVQFFGC